MTDFVWPSDIDRAENDELNRVCERLEEVTDDRDDLAVRLGKISDAWDSCLGWPDTSDDKIRLGEVIRRYEQ